MEIEQPKITKMHQSVVRKTDIFGASKQGANKFDNREECEPIGLPFPSMKIDAIYFWYQNTDQQDVSLQGLRVDYKKVHEDSYFDSGEHVAKNCKKLDKQPDLFVLEDGEFIKEITVGTAGNNNIGFLEFLTSRRNEEDPTKWNTPIYFGKQPELENEENKQAPIAPTCDKKANFNFWKDREYVIGFYGEYDNNFITYLGVYTASIQHINYYIRRPYILLYKKTLTDKTILQKTFGDFKMERVNNKIRQEPILEVKDPQQVGGDRLLVEKPAPEGALANLYDSSTRVLFYILDESVTNPDLFTEMVPYLY